MCVCINIYIYTCKTGDPGHALSGNQLRNMHSKKNPRGPNMPKKTFIKNTKTTKDNKEPTTLKEPTTNTRTEQANRTTKQTTCWHSWNLVPEFPRVPKTCFACFFWQVWFWCFFFYCTYSGIGKGALHFVYFPDHQANTHPCRLIGKRCWYAGT